MSIDDATEAEWSASARRFLEENRRKKKEQEKASTRQVGGNHYKNLAIQPIEYILANNLDYCEANVVKYITRHASKGGLEDLDKVIHYVELLKEQKYGE
jgi:hypothetical protein